MAPPTEPKEDTPPSRPKRRRYSKVNYPIKRLSFPDLPWVVPEVFLPCPHQHLNSYTINRDYLNTEEQLNLLSTPKGYRWYSKSDNLVRRMILKEPGKKRPIPKKPSVGFKQFMFEIWKVLTPDMIARLIEILQEEFQMSPQEAIDFLKVQKEKAMRQAKEEVLGPAPHLTGEDICWARGVAGTIADKCTSCSEVMSVYPRSKRTARLIARLRGQLHGGLKLKDQGPNSPLRLLLYRAADLLAVWMGTHPAEPGLSTACRHLWNKSRSTVSLV